MRTETSVSKLLELDWWTFSKSMTFLPMFPSLWEAGVVRCFTAPRLMVGIVSKNWGGKDWFPLPGAHWRGGGTKAHRERTLMRCGHIYSVMCVDPAPWEPRWRRGWLRWRESGNASQGRGHLGWGINNEESIHLRKTRGGVPSFPGRGEQCVQRQVTSTSYLKLLGPRCVSECGHLFWY